MNAVAASLGVLSRRPGPNWALFPWIGFLVITACYFITTHDVERARYVNERSVEEFNPTITEALDLLAQYEAGSMIKALAYLTLGAWGFLTAALVLRRQRIQVHGIMAYTALAFFAVVCLSYLWADRPEITLNKIIIFVLLVFGGLGMALRFRPQDILLFVVLSSTLYLLIGVGAEVALGTFKPWLPGYRFSGTIHPNGQGLNCALLVLAAVFAGLRYPAWRRVFWGIALAAFAFLILTKSRTPLGVLFLVVIAYWIATRPMPIKLMLTLFGGMVVCFVLIFNDSLIPWLASVVKLGRTDLQQVGETGKTLTGRTELWAVTWQYIMDHPLLGWGYNSFWTVENNLEIGEKTDWLSGSAHSIYLDLLLGLGFIGAGLYLWTVALALWRALRYRTLAADEPAYAFLWMVLLFSLLHGITESTFLFPAMHTFLIIAIVIQFAYLPPPLAEPEEALEAAPRTPLQPTRRVATR